MSSNISAGMIVEAIRNGKTVADAKRAAGYSPKSALSSKLPKSTMAQLIEMAGGRAKLGQVFKPAERADIVRGTLTRIALTGDESNQIRAAELIGKDREVAMWQSESMVGAVVITIPEEYAARYGAQLAVPLPAPITIDAVPTPPSDIYIKDTSAPLVSPAESAIRAVGVPAIDPREPTRAGAECSAAVTPPIHKKLQSPNSAKTSSKRGRPRKRPDLYAK